MKFSSSFKVGLLAFLSLVLLLGVVIRVKGRTFSNAKRVEIRFNDVNGMRPGAAVQMMGMRVGQVEEVTPIISEEENYVKVKFVITEKNINIPKASACSIQQSGLIGELFLEITPPKTRTVYLPMITKDILYKDDIVKMKLDEKVYDVGKIKEISIVSHELVPYYLRELVDTHYAYKVDYIVDLPGLILPEFMKAKLLTSKNEANSMLISTLDDVVLPYPTQESPYTIIEPMRIADFMEWQYKAAEGLTETNKKINELLSTELISELHASVGNINALTSDASAVIAKINAFMEDDLNDLIKIADSATKDFHDLTVGINKLLEDKDVKKAVLETATSFNTITKDIDKLFGNDEQSQQLSSDFRAIVANLNDISKFVNAMTKDETLKGSINSSIKNLNKAMLDISTALAPLNSVNSDNKTEVQAMLDDATATTANLRKFSEKLNKRFLLFRLMF